jgi:hypothetical protein
LGVETICQTDAGVYNKPMPLSVVPNKSHVAGMTNIQENTRGCRDSLQNKKFDKFKSKNKKTTEMFEKIRYIIF